MFEAEFQKMLTLMQYQCRRLKAIEELLKEPITPDSVIPDKTEEVPK